MLLNRNLSLRFLHYFDNSKRSNSGIVINILYFQDLITNDLLHEDTTIAAALVKEKHFSIIAIYCLLIFLCMITFVFLMTVSRARITKRAILYLSGKIDQPVTSLHPSHKEIR